MISWCEGNKLTINRGKTKFMLVKHTKVSCESQVRIGNYKLGTVSSYEYLGIVLDDKLSMNDYLETMLKKLMQKLGFWQKSGVLSQREQP